MGFGRLTVELTLKNGDQLTQRASLGQTASDLVLRQRAEFDSSNIFIRPTLFKPVSECRERLPDSPRVILSEAL